MPLAGEPLLLAASADGHQVAVGYEEGGGAGVRGRVEVFHVGDLRQKDARPRAAHALPHGLRVLRWSRAGRPRLLAGGGRHLSFLWDDGKLTTRALPRALGAADWSPAQDDVVAVSYFGEGACVGRERRSSRWLGGLFGGVSLTFPSMPTPTAAPEAPMSPMDPFFLSAGQLVLERAPSGEVTKALPCRVRDVNDDPATIDEEDPDGAADRRNIVHLAWLAPDVLVGVNRKGDVGLLQPAAAAAGSGGSGSDGELEPSGLPPLAPPTMEARFFAALLQLPPAAAAGNASSSKWLFVANSLEQYVRSADLTKPLETDPDRRTGQPRARALAPAATDGALTKGWGE